VPSTSSSRGRRDASVIVGGGKSRTRRAAEEDERARAEDVLGVELSDGLEGELVARPSRARHAARAGARDEVRSLWLVPSGKMRMLPPSRVLRDTLEAASLSSRSCPARRGVGRSARRRPPEATAPGIFQSVPLRSARSRRACGRERWDRRAR
jgi:hypothetical protein